LPTPRRIGALVCLIVLVAAAARPPERRLASGRIAAVNWPYFPGSLFALRVQGFAAPYGTALLGPGRLLPGGIYAVPQSGKPAQALIVAGNAAGLAAATLRIAPPPPATRALVVVAAYEDGLVVHDARDFAPVGVLATGGAPSDTAIDASGRIAVTDTQGSTLTFATLAPWRVAQVPGVPLGDEIALEESPRTAFVTNREADGGALTRVGPGGAATRVATGETAEGLAIDRRRRLVYVADTNDGSVAEVDAGTMRVIRRFHVVDRVFSLALSPDGDRLYAVSNESAGSPFAAAGSVVAISLTDGKPHGTQRSGPLAFPVGIAINPAGTTLFVTDESLDRVYVLDARTLRAKHAELTTCRTPWKPTLDAPSLRLYVPCAGADAVDVFDLRTMRRVPRAPFATGGYPLAVAVWHPRST
jgi:DNA-binding beta-propeller fold protein YncE